MSFISYAQNYEDVMLIRALRGVKHGFYIDVGAQDPVDDSVTKAFYEMGWRGINIEPVTHWFQRLVADRPHDINLQLAVSDSPGKLHLFEVIDSGLSTTDRDFAKRHAKAGHQIRESDVKCVTLDEVCRTHQIGEIHFLKIDCEGGEAAALRGLSLERTRPWVILLEATEPNSQTPAYMEWESLLTGRGYHFVYEDGLNRFYVADEHAELDQALSRPPNVFDYFVRASEAMARSQLQAAQDDLLAMRDAQRVVRAESDCEQLRASVEYLHNENERREAALIEHRRLLDEAAEREAQSVARVQTESEQWRIHAEYLRNENERREAALIEHRRLLDEAAEREAQSVACVQTESEQWRIHAEYLRNENERREAALIEHRRLLDEAAEDVKRMQAEREQWRNDAERLHEENERKEQFLVERRQAIATLEDTLAASLANLAAATERTKLLGDDLAKREHDLTLLRADLDSRSAEILQLQIETDRLHREVASRDREVGRLHGLIQTIHHSTSWRITLPLRLIRRAARALLAVVFLIIYQVLRRPARFVRPLLRVMARWSWLRSLALRITGPDSRLTAQARLFLFGAAPATHLHEQLETKQLDVPLTRQATRVLEEIQISRRKRLHGNSPTQSGRR
ncbi:MULTISPECIES: FkbM family methyltransferase [unclassified Rhodanobacter]|nr:FkbM family methyltransferase [Rhodanobacter sp. FW510-T8]